MKKNSQEIINALTNIIEILDPSTCSHSKRVANYAVLLGKALKLSSKQLKDIYYAALLHDLGKIGTPISIIQKQGPLTKREYNIIKMHPENGAIILRNFSDFKDIVPIVRHHHEMFGGGGYPDGLVGNQITLSARILSIVDVYDALTSKRSYHKARSSKFAVNYILKNTPSQFDPKLVNILVKILVKIEKSRKLVKNL